MHIIHIASELAPIAKAGGLGDVVYGLSKELLRIGNQVQIIIPKYDCIQYNLLQNLEVYYRDLWSFDGPYRYNNTIWTAQIEGIQVFLIEPHHQNYFFSRGTIYGCPDDIDRFLYFSRTAMEFLFKAGLFPDVLHIHDWPTAVIPILYKDMYLSLGFHPCKTLLTLHNLEHQGRCETKNLSNIGLRGEDYLAPHKLQDPNHPHLLNLLKGGILYAESLTTVSPSYEKEIKTKAGGHGLEIWLKQHQNKIKGVLNGVDEDFWNPAVDPYLIKQFPSHPPITKEKWILIEQGKAANKKHLRNLFHLEDKPVPLVACITRLVLQKGPFLIEKAFRHILASGAQCIILGSVFSQDIQDLFLALQAEFANSSQGAIILNYNESLAHLIYAASDLCIIPSLFEPCGLSQMIALRYSSLPIVRKTGGLGDTIFDQENGFVFSQPTHEEFHKTLDRALKLYKEKPKEWKNLVLKGLSKDFSWKTAAQEYLNQYR